MRFTKSFRALRSILSRGSLGQRAEAVAARYLQKQGLQILARNWRTRQGEIDIVALAGSIVVFVEVKSRTLGNTAPGVTDERDPLERIDHEKVQRIRRAARSYLRRARGSYQGSRIDGLVIDFTRGFAGRKVPASIRWYQALHSME